MTIIEKYIHSNCTIIALQLECYAGQSHHQDPKEIIRDITGDDRRDRFLQHNGVHRFCPEDTGFYREDQRG